MTEQELILELLKVIKQNKLAEATEGQSSQISDCKKHGKRYFNAQPLRLIALINYARKEGLSQVLSITQAYIREHWPTLLKVERRLPEFLSDPWQELTLYLPEASYLPSMLEAIHCDARDALGRTLVLVFKANMPTPEKLDRFIQQHCMKHLPLVYRTRIADVQLPAGLPPLLYANGQLLLLSDDGFIPLGHSLQTLWQKSISTLAGEIMEVIRSGPYIHGSVPSTPVPGAGERCYRVRFDRRNGGSVELNLERVDDENWIMDLQAREVPAGTLLRLVDQGGSPLINTTSDYLPWQGVWPRKGINPKPIVEQLHLIETGEDND
jgi:hypothetical protein